VSLGDRLRIRLFAGAVTPDWFYGDDVFGGYTYGRRIEELQPDGKPFSCRVVGVSMNIGRRRNLDQNDIGTLRVEAVQFAVPDSWLSADGNTTPESVVVGRRMTLEALNNGVWEAVFTGSVEYAQAEVIGTGVFDEPAIRWEFSVLDALARLRQVTEAPGTVYRGYEGMSERLAFIASRVGLAAEKFTTNYTVMETEFERDLLAEAQSIAFVGARISASNTGDTINTESVFTSGVSWSTGVITGTRWLASPHLIMTHASNRLLLPIPNRVSQSWPADLLLNEVVITTPDVPTDPTPANYIHTDETSINDFGRRSYVNSDARTVEGPTSYPARGFGLNVMTWYRNPKPWVTEVDLDFTNVIDLDTPEPVGKWPSVRDTVTIGLAFALVRLRQAEQIHLTMPPSSNGTLIGAAGRVLGVSWSISDASARLTLALEGIARRLPDTPLERTCS
jgi:hypothetical protein